MYISTHCSYTDSCEPSSGCSELNLVPLLPQVGWVVCEPPCGCWDLNSGPLKAQSVLLPAEPSHQPAGLFLITANSLAPASQHQFSH